MEMLLAIMLPETGINLADAAIPAAAAAAVLILLIVLGKVGKNKKKK